MTSATGMYASLTAEPLFALAELDTSVFSVPSHKIQKVVISAKVNIQGVSAIEFNTQTNKDKFAAAMEVRVHNKTLFHTRNKVASIAVLSLHPNPLTTPHLILTSTSIQLQASLSGGAKVTDVVGTNVARRRRNLLATSLDVRCVVWEV